MTSAPPPAATSKGTWRFGAIISVLVLGMYALALVEAGSTSRENEQRAARLTEKIEALRQPLAPAVEVATSTHLRVAWKSAAEFVMETQCAGPDPVACTALSLDAVEEALRRSPPRE